MKTILYFNVEFIVADLSGNQWLQNLHAKITEIKTKLASTNRNDYQIMLVSNHLSIANEHMALLNKAKHKSTKLNDLTELQAKETVYNEPEFEFIALGFSKKENKKTKQLLLTVSADDQASLPFFPTNAKPDLYLKLQSMLIDIDSIPQQKRELVRHAFYQFTLLNSVTLRDINSFDRCVANFAETHGQENEALNANWFAWFVENNNKNVDLQT